MDSFIGSTGSVLMWTVRIIFLALIFGIAGQAMVVYRFQIPEAYVSGALIAGVGIAILFGDILIRNKQITTISAIYFGLLMGFLLGHLLGSALQPFIQGYFEPIARESPELGQNLMRLINVCFVLICCYISVSVLVQTKDDFRFIIPYVEFSKQLKGAKPLVLDTSVIIDGRIADICETGILDTKVIVPRFVLQELQGIADSSDKIKRNRGRRGLDVLKKIQSNQKIELQMHDGNLVELRDLHKVDERLVMLAKVLSGRVVTNDFNLNKIAQLQGVDVINLNELSNALKLVALPGEALSVRIVKQGDQLGQGVGYLDDGTMVVVEQGRTMIGHDVPITVTSVLQTPAGRMIFGKIESRAAATG